PTFLLDMYLNSHIPQLYTLIRRRAIVQYIHPFEAVDLKKMSVAFGGSSSETDVALLESEVANLVSDGVVKARIDSHNKILRINKSDKRNVMFEKTIKMGDEYVKQASFLLLRASLMKQDMFVEAPHAEFGERERGERGDRADRYQNRMMA
ncbi:cop9 signalosome complex subunit, partial [Rhizoclosmatium hyalinum]